MVEIKPFTGIYFNPDIVKDFGKVLAPPYDIISDEEREELLKSSPYNIVRITKGKEENGDDEQENKYSRAAQVYHNWLEKGILTRSDRPCMFIYEQEYMAGGVKKKRKCLIARMRLEPFERGNVLPHEKTFPKITMDRLMLLRATKANFGQIFTLFEDKNKEISKIMEEEEKNAPIIKLVDKDKVTHRLWEIDDDDPILRLERAMKYTKVYIADGHHRYETSVKYMEEMRTKTHKILSDEPWNFRMMTFVSMDEGLTILPVHRLLSGIEYLNMAKIEEKCKKFFDVSAFRFDSKNKEQQLKMMMDMMKMKKHMFGMYCKGSHTFYALRLKDAGMLDKLVNNRCAAFNRLDVNVVHKIFIEKVLLIDEDEQQILYVKDGIQKIVDPSYENDYQMALFLNPTKVEEMKEIADMGQKMPHKSTYFYPKLITGIVMNSVEE